MAASELQRSKYVLDAKRKLYLEQSRQPQTDEEKRTFMDTLYGEWMENDSYDKDMEVLGYVGHVALAELVCRYITDKSSRLLDGACGSGLLGQELKRRGFTALDALDASKEALDCCRKKGVHDNYWCEMLGPNRLPIQDDTYDGVCLAAGVGDAHVNLDCFPELIRITKSGGYIIFNVAEICCVGGRVFGNGQLDAFLHDMAAKGRWEYLEKKRSLYMKSQQDELVEYAYRFVVKVL